MKQLTRAEEEIMQHIWTLKQAFVKEVLAEIPEPKPAYNTISTIVRILEQKGFLGYKAFGKSHRYFPLISKEEYSKVNLQNMVKNYFDGSFQQLVSFFVKEENLSLQEIEELKNKIEENNK